MSMGKKISEKSVRYFTQRISAFFLLGTWVAVMVMGGFGVFQVLKIRYEMQLIGEHVLELSQGVIQISLGQAELSQLVADWEEYPDALRGRLSHVLEGQRHSIRVLLDKIDAIKQDPDHVVHREGLSMLERVARKLEAKFSVMYRLDASGGLLPEVYQRPDYVREEIESKIEHLSKTIAIVGHEAISEASRFERTAISELLVVGLLTLFLGAYLWRWLHRLERRILESEKLSSLAAMTVALHHEINNPLAVIVGNTYLLLNGKLGEKEKEESIKLIHEMSQRISKVVKKAGELQEIRTVDYLQGEKMVDLSGV